MEEAVMARGRKYILQFDRRLEKSDFSTPPPKTVKRRPRRKGEFEEDWIRQLKEERRAFLFAKKQNLEDDDKEEVQPPLAIFVSPLENVVKVEIGDQCSIEQEEDGVIESVEEKKLGADVEEDVKPPLELFNFPYEDEGKKEETGEKCIVEQGYQAFNLSYVEFKEEEVEELSSVPDIFDLENKEDSIDSALHLNANNSQSAAFSQVCNVPVEQSATQKRYCQEKPRYLLTVDIETRKKKYLCAECSHKTYLLIKMKKHIQQVHPIKTSFKRSTLKQSVIPSSRKPLKCSQCDFRTMLPEYLRKHKKIHSGERPYKCDRCDFASARKDNMKLHMLTHTRKKRYKCPECDFETTLKINLRMHRISHCVHKTDQYSCFFPTLQPSNITSKRRKQQLKPRTEEL